jgi:hypothetical protein
MSKTSSSIYIITRLKRNCINANEGSGTCHMEITQIIISLSRKIAPLVSLYRHKACGSQKPAFQIIPIVAEKATEQHARETD